MSQRREKGLFYPLRHFGHFWNSIENLLPFSDIFDQIDLIFFRLFQIKFGWQKKNRQLTEKHPFWVRRVQLETSWCQAYFRPNLSKNVLNKFSPSGCSIHWGLFIAAENGLVINRCSSSHCFLQIEERCERATEKSTKDSKLCELLNKRVQCLEEELLQVRSKPSAVGGIVTWKPELRLIENLSSLQKKVSICRNKGRESGVGRELHSVYA